MGGYVSVVFFFKQKTAYEMRISDWSSDVCSSDLLVKEGTLVKAGDVLAKLSDDEERAQVAVAQAKLAQAKADLALAKKGGKAEEVQVAESAVGTAKQRAQVSAQQAQRLATAFKHNSVTAQEYERARGLAEVDRKTLAEMQSKLDLVRSGADAERLDRKSVV